MILIINYYNILLNMIIITKNTIQKKELYNYK